MDFIHLKALHFIFMVTWFAGLFYLPRLFVYSAEAVQKQEPERSILLNQYLLMQKRLMYGIMWPSIILLFFFGGWMMILGEYWNIPWFRIKLGLLTGLTIFHIYCQVILNQHIKGEYRHGGQWFRVFNEIPTLFLFAIIFLAIFKNSLDMFKGLGWLLALIVIILSGIYFYKRARESKKPV